MSKTRKELLQHFKDGYTVIVDGVHYLSPDDLPTEAELAKGDVQREAAAKADINKQIADLKSQLQYIEADADYAEEVDAAEKKVADEKKAAEKHAPKAPDAARVAPDAQNADAKAAADKKAKADADAKAEAEKK